MDRVVARALTWALTFGSAGCAPTFTAPCPEELCNGVDDDCDGVVDEGAADAVDAWTDADGDGFGGGELQRVCELGALVPVGGDCDDADPARHPGVAEGCDGIDDDCDPSTVDEGSDALRLAVARAASGAVLAVCPGTYRVSDLLVDEALTIVGDPLDPAAVVLDADAAGPVFVVDGGALTLEGLTLRHGAGHDVGGVRFGGAIDASNGLQGAVVARGCVFEGNRATWGGAISGDDVTLEDSTLRANVAEYGGAVHHGYGWLTAVRSTFEGNRAVQGGAVRSHGTVLIDSVIRDNRADEGGGVYSAFNTNGVSLENTVVEGNEAVHGGGVRAYDADVTLDATSRVSSNRATWGGGVSLLGDATWTGGTIDGNAALHGGGVAVSLAPALREVTVTGNTARKTGGGVWSAGGLTLSDSVVSDNEAGMRGGGVFHESVVPIIATLERVELRGNHARWGGGYMQYSQRAPDVVTQMTECVVAENTARHGGGVYLFRTTLEAIDADFGAAAPDNDPSDVELANHDGVFGASFAYGDGVTFDCDAAALVCQ